jgi:type II secretory pathway component PulJ
MTLIELILAIAIASLVITLVFSLYHTVSVTMQAQEERRRGADAAADAVQQIARDLACAFAPKSDEACKFALKKDSNGIPASQLSFCSAVMPEGETDLRWFEIHRVAYRVGIDAKMASVLFRENQPLVGPGAFEPLGTNALAGNVESFHVSVHDGLGWKDEWASTGDAPCPRAARIEVTARYGSGVKTFQTEVLIPAGNSISSTVTRTIL